MSTRVRIINGDIGDIKADALITAINSYGDWDGAIDHLIRGVAGLQYHDQAYSHMPLSSGNMVLAVEEDLHDGRFRNVLFVVDDLDRPLNHLVMHGLMAVHQQHMTSVSLPMIRMGNALGIVERNEAEAVQEMAWGVRLFLERCPHTTIQTITFVVFHNPALERLLREAMARELVTQ